VRNALWVQVGAAFLTFIIASILFLRYQPKLAAHSKPAYQTKPWLMALLPFTLISLVGTFNAQIGIVLLGFLGSDEAVAALQVGERGAQFVSLALMLVNMIISPHIVKAYKDGDTQLLQQLSRKSSRGAFAIALFVGLILIIFGKPIIHLAFGAAYVEGTYLPMVILVVANWFNVALGSVGILLIMSGHEKVTLWGQIFGLLATVISAFILIPLYQAVGAAIAVAIGLVVWNSVLGFSVFKYLKIRPGIL